MVKDKTKEHIEWLENTINETYGSKCPDYVKECWCCKAWELILKPFLVSEKCKHDCRQSYHN